MAIGTTAAIALGLGTALAGGGAAYSASQQSKMSKKAIQAQEDLNAPQKEQMAAYLPYYREILPLISGELKSRIGATTLPEATAQAIGKYYNQAGEQLGTYGASRNMLNSGVMDTLYTNLLAEKAGTQTSALQSLRDTGMSEGLQFLGMTPSYNPTNPYAGISTTTSNIDWSSIGSLLSKLNFGGTPTASPILYNV